MIADIIRGTLVIIIIMIVSGVIAYVGDRVGHQIGRKRLTLFGMRPRYTSTIVAVGTGMLISLVVTLAAIIFSQQVKTALFRMNQISLQITQLETRERDLEKKVSTGQLVVPVDSLMVPYVATIPRGTPVDQRLKIVHTFYDQSVVFMNQNYVPRGLKPFVAPSDLNDRLQALFGQPQVTRASLQNKLLVYVTSDQNLYRGDQIHFNLGIIDDAQRLRRGEAIASLREIPGGRNADINLAIGELEQLVTNIGGSSDHGLNLPPFLANNVRVISGSPSAAQMQAMLRRPGRYTLSAYAAEDIYPDTGGIPIVITLTPSS